MGIVASTSGIANLLTRRHRWIILGLLMAYTILCHFNRVSMSVAGTERIISETITATQMGTVYSAYLLAYTLAMVPAGCLIDRRGPRYALTFMGFGSAALVALTGFAASVPDLLLYLLGVRALIGAVSAPIHPAAARTVGYWFCYSSRPLANGLVNAAAVGGVASTYVVFGGLIDLCDWPAAFLISGAATGVVALCWAVCARDRPSEQSAVNVGQEVDAVDRQTETLSSVSTSFAPASLLRNRRLWFITASYGMLGYFQYLFFYWQEYYFERVLEVEREQARIYATVPTLAMAVGMIAGGWLFARLQRAKTLRVRHALLPAAGMAASGAFVVLGLLRSDPIWALVTFSLAMASAGLGEGSFWTTAVEIGGCSGGVSAALMNTGGNAGGALAPMLTPLLASQLGWQGGIALAGVFCFAGAVLWLWIVPERGPQAV